MNADEWDNYMSYVRKFKPTEGDEIMDALNTYERIIELDPRPQQALQPEYKVEKVNKNRCE